MGWMGRWVIGLILMGLVGQAAWAATPVTVRWLGQACFLVTAANGTRILLDPYGSGVGYPVVPQDADIVTVSHEHFDHNNVAMARGKPAIVRGLTDGGKHWANVKQTVKGVGIRSVGVYHDPNQGQERGLNAVFVLQVSGIRLAHLGDLGHLLTRDQLGAIGPVDVLMIPVGGHFTIDGAQADLIAKQLHPRVVIPMHYKTPATSPDLPISDLQPFLRAQKYPVKQGGKLLSLSRGTLPQATTVITMDYS